MKVSELKMVTPDDARKMLTTGSMCAWRGCGAHFKDDMPRGWVWLLSYWRRKPALHVADIDHWQRDAALCPEHATALDGQLVDLGCALSAPATGRA